MHTHRFQFRKRGHDILIHNRCVHGLYFERFRGRRQRILAHQVEQVPIRPAAGRAGSSFPAKEADRHFVKWPGRKFGQAPDGFQQNAVDVSHLRVQSCQTRSKQSPGHIDLGGVVLKRRGIGEGHGYGLFT